MAEPLEDAVESEDKKIALIIAILALFLALAEAGAKNAEHRSTEQNIESSDLFNFYTDNVACRKKKRGLPGEPDTFRRSC